MANTTIEDDNITRIHRFNKCFKYFYRKTLNKKNCDNISIPVDAKHDTNNCAIDDNKYIDNLIQTFDHIQIKNNNSINGSKTKTQPHDQTIYTSNYNKKSGYIYNKLKRLKIIGPILDSLVKNEINDKSTFVNKLNQLRSRSSFVSKLKLDRSNVYKSLNKNAQTNTLSVSRKGGLILFNKNETTSNILN